MKRNVSAIVREAVVWRDDWTCKICKHELIEDQWHCDHIKPLWDGGTNEETNLQAICANCHAGKTAREARERLAKRRAEEQERREREMEERRKKFGFIDLRQYAYDPSEI